jgi:hypothetical protein
MNLTDLLFTNQFISSDSFSLNHPNTNLKCSQIKPKLEDKSINKNRVRNEIVELKEYLKEELSNSNDRKIVIYNNLEENEDDFDVLDPQIRNPEITANLIRPQWIYNQQQLSLSSSIQPIFDNRVDDLKSRYRKNISSFLNVDSRHRNSEQYPNPGNYNIYINKEFKYIQSIKLKSIEFREAPPPINESNNTITWITNYTGVQGAIPGTRVQYYTVIPSAFYTLDSFVQVVEASMNSIQHNLPGSLNGLYPNFGLYINPSTKSLILMERLEILPIDTLTTTKNSNQIKITMTYEPLDPVSSNCTVNDGLGYPFKPDFEDIPIIFSGLDLFYQEYGNIPTLDILNNVPFYTKNQVDTNPKLYHKSYYTCEGNTGVFNYTLHVYDKCGNTAKASYTKTYDMKATTTLLSNPTAGHPLQVVVGRALKVEILTNCTSTFGSFLGLTTANKSVYLNTNYNKKTLIIMNKINWKMLEYGQLSLCAEEYIFMRIGTIAKPFDTISDNLTDAYGGTTSMQLASTKDNNFFAKIIFSDKDPGDISIISVGGKKIFYNAPLVSLSDLSIQFLLANGKIMNLFQNHSFTLEIVELREVLNDTLIDSRTGNISDIGK